MSHLFHTIYFFPSVIIAGLFVPECGQTYSVLPGNEITVTSPGFSRNKPLQPGVLCKWNIRTTDKYLLILIFKTLNLTSDHNFNISCRDSFVSITDATKLCQMTSSNETIYSHQSNATILLKTGNHASGKGFKLSVTSVMKLPGSPEQVKLQTLEHAVMLSWKPPAENTLPITAYHIRYSVVFVRKSFLVTVSASMRYYVVNTRTYEGQMMKFNITALIGRKEGEVSNTLYARARK